MKTKTDLDRSTSARRRRWLAAAAAVAVVGAVLLAAFQPWKLVVDETVNEAAPPTATATTPPATQTPPTTAASTVTTAASTATTGTATATASTSTTAVVPAGADPSPPTDPSTAPDAATASPAITPTTAASAAATALTPVTTAQPALVEPASTAFTGKAHPTSGTVRLIPQADGSRVLRIEDLNTENGPDVKVVLSPDPDGYAEGAVSLGTLKGNKGSQNYAVSADLDLSSVRSVVIWCKRFRVDFAVAPFPGV
jgi:cytoskeletal protein RodZ